MAFNPDQVAASYHYLVEIALDGKTLRYAETDLSMDNGNFYEGRFALNTTIRRNLGSLVQDNYIADSFQVALANHDDVVRGFLTSYQWANRAITILIGYDTTYANYATLIQGIIRFPGGVSYVPDQVLIVCEDVRKRDDIMLPPHYFDPATYPNMETKSQYQFIPIAWGSWLSTDAGAVAVPCFQIDSTVGTGGSFKIADHALKQIEAVYKNGSSVSFSVTSLTAATFTLNVVYAPSTDTITATVRGTTDDGTSSGNLIQTASDYLKDILKTWLGKTNSDLSLSDFAAFKAANGDLLRRWIGGSTQIQASALIAQLMIESWCDLTLSANQYKPVYRIVDVSAGVPTYYAWDIQRSGPGAGAQAAFQVSRDPDRLYANRIVGRYRPNPSTGVFGVVYQFDDATAQTDVKSVEQRDLDLSWHYLASTAQSRVQREEFVFGTAEIEVVDATLLGRTILKAPTDQFRLIYDKYGDASTGVGTPFQIRGSEIQTGRVNNVMTIWNMLNLSPGRWTEDSATTWLLSTTFQRSTQGYWTDASGYADTSGSPDPTSKRSKWY